jgi:hypothetical protein
MALLYAAGQYYNLLERALSVTLNPAADALFPATNLYDGRLSKGARHGSNAANPTITWDGAAFTPGTSATYTFTARAGERRRVTSGGTSNVTVQNLSTLKYLTSGGAWQVASTYCLTGAGSVDYQVESLTLCQLPAVSLKITQSATVTLSDWPRWNSVMVFGHNLDAGLSVEMRSSTDNFSGSNVLEVTGSILQPSFYMNKGSAITSRYGRVALTGTNQAIPWYASVAPMYLETMTTGQSADGYEVALEEVQIRNDSAVATSNVYNMSPWPRRTISLHFRSGTAAALELRQEIVLRCRGGAYPFVVVPVSTEGTILMTRLGANWSEVRKLLTHWTSDLTATEDAILTPLA